MANSIILTLSKSTQINNLSEHAISELDWPSINSSNLDHSKGGNGVVAFQIKQQVTAQSLDF